MTRTKDGLIVPREARLIPVEGVRFDSAIIPCDLHFDEATVNALASLSITNGERSGRFFGAADDPDMLRVSTELIKSLGDNDDETVALVSAAIVDLAQHSARITEDEALWLELRAGSEANSDYDTPRWHPDGKFFETAPGRTPYKFATTLVGPKTRLGTTTQRDKFIKLLRSFPHEECYTPKGLRIREEMDQLVDEYTPAETGEGAFFLVSHDDAAIHSEPPIDGSRLFMFTLGGPLEQIKALGVRRGDG